jgi:hypothetical protein
MYRDSHPRSLQQTSSKSVQYGLSFTGCRGVLMVV